uniref:G_PROTEIN_RECEP_F1_2 domain-containing protein n=1 Tax=Elaeophora elaphi TaxID=1147741 RepID=A0A0R3RJP7_9BILA
MTGFRYIIILFLILPLRCQEKDTTEEDDIRDDNHMVAKYIALLLFIIFLLYGFISNILMGVVLFHRRRENYYSYEFILIAIQLIICNFTTFVPQMVVVLPEMLQNKNNSCPNETTWMNQTFSTLNTFSIFSVLHFSLLLALNRFVALILPKYYAFFESTRLHLIIAFVWLSSLVITTADYYYCTRRFHVQSLSWIGDCTKSNEAGNLWWRIRFGWALIIPYAMFIMYIAIFFNIRRITKIRTGHKANVVKIYHYEWSMLLQAAWNCGILEAGIILFHFLSPILIQIFGKEMNIRSKIFINCYIIFTCSILPTIHFIHSKQARDTIKHQFYKCLHMRNKNRLSQM